MNQDDKDGALFFQKAFQALNSAKKTLEDDQENAVNRSHQSMFFAASGILALKGVKGIKTHQEVMDKFEELFVKTGLLEEELGRELERVENLGHKADYDPNITFSHQEAQEQIEKAEHFLSAVEQVTGLNQESQRDLPNMADVQAAESKASMIQSLDKSADGMSMVEGKDVNYIEEGYMLAANEVKYEAQQARTANAEAQTKEGFKIGDRVVFQPHAAKSKVTGTITATNEEKDGNKKVTLKSGPLSITVSDDKGTFSKAPSIEKEGSKEYAKDLAMKALGPEGKVLLARNKGAYTGPIIGMTSTFAIQKVNENTAVLHRLKDLQTQDKDAQGLIREGEDLTIVKDGTGVSISRTEARDRDNDKVRTQQKTRGSMSR